MIRVAHVVSSFDVGGTELNAVRQVERLDRTRFDVRMLCLSDRGPLRARCEAAGVPVVPFEVQGLLRPRTLARANALRRYLKRERIDVLHAHDIYSNMFAIAPARLAGVPLVIGSRRWWSQTNRRLHGRLNRAACRLADIVTTNAASIATMLVRDEGLPPDRVITVTNFVDDGAFDPPTEVALGALRERLGIASDDLVIGCVANLNPIKGHPTLLRAFPRVLAEFPDALLVCVGEGQERPRLEALARELGVEHRVRFPGLMPHQPSPHWCFDVSVLSSVDEAFPNSLVEAMAAGRPVVATRVGGVPDLVAPGETGLLVDSGDSVSMGAALATLLRDEAARRRFGQEGLRVARERFMAAPVVRGLEQMYMNGLQRVGHAPGGCL